MLKHLIAGCCLAVMATSTTAQTLFTYADDAVTVKDFLYAYQKNNTGSKDPKALQAYLDLYIASRLKIKEAREKGYHTLPQVVADLDNLREQILPTYLKDEESVNKLVDEAFTRSGRDIQLAHIFITINKDGLPDAAGAKKRADEAYTLLQKGKDFAAVAKQYSDDPSAATNGGAIGYITVFTLPYELENLAYATPSGKISPIYATKSGYHIFKNLGERKALGSLKAAQILLAFPPDADAATKGAVKKLADSLYNRLTKGDDFGKLAAAFSADAVSAAANGQLPTFGVGQYEALFEKTVYGLPKDGAISQPFATAHGYHIVKRLAKVPPPASKNDAKGMQQLREKVEASDRLSTTTSVLIQKILQSAPFQKSPFAEAALWAYSDSLLEGKSAAQAASLNGEAPLFKLGREAVTAAEWIQFAQTARYKNDGSGLKPYADVWNEFVQASALEYYKTHLEDYNEAFRRQITEFEEGSLFFEIMQRQVWNSAGEDSAALLAYYNKHKSKYLWQKSADAVLFYAPDAATAKSFRTALAKQPAKWKSLIAAGNNAVAADSGRFELSMVPNGDRQALKNGMLTAPVDGSGDGTFSFALVQQVFNQPVQRTFAEAKGQVISDYQAELEKVWVAELKKKYPVVVNEKAWASILGKK